MQGLLGPLIIMMLNSVENHAFVQYGLPNDDDEYILISMPNAGYMQCLLSATQNI